jgi:hypothetical protein
MTVFGITQKAKDDARECVRVILAEDLNDKRSRAERSCYLWAVAEKYRAGHPDAFSVFRIAAHWYDEGRFHEAIRVLRHKIVGNWPWPVTH